ncbi:ABC transporter permease [Pseudactinotalea terrae]|uniref:ABC transporter permease n=1 Tax=Pseudactinotalea terrae TaxID=1743262 RepID=UPI0012E29408|nr:ABC transporter permease [Pseudactinotalea terrae]
MAQEARTGARLPAWILVPAGLGLALLVIPLLAMLPRVDWARLPATITSPAALDALWLSVRTATLAVLLCLLLGVPLALAMARARPRAAAILRALVTLPLVLPPLVGGVALLAVVGRTGVLGRWLEATGVSIAFTPWAVVLAQTFVSLPFLVITVEGSLRTVGDRYQVVAATLGARPATVLRRVSLPLIAPSLLAGTVLAFTRALGEFGATALVAGNRPGVTQTVPMAIYTAFNGAGVTRDVALVLSVLLVATALAILVLVPAVRRREAW